MVVVEPMKETPPTSVPDPHPGQTPTDSMKAVVEAATGPQPKTISLDELFGGH
tara:strand:- start:230 stop:388 length:159 start_codon:yes stop_codon:yes gene_type:complete